LVGSSSVTVIDGATNATTTVGAGGAPFSVAVNPVTNKIYVANFLSNNVPLLAEEQVQTIPLTTTISQKKPEFPQLRARKEAARIKDMQARIEACDSGSGDWKRFQWFLKCIDNSTPRARVGRKESEGLASERR
jgi:YVTN family beta-propeller protein